MDHQILSESDVKEKFITPAMFRTGWDEHSQIRREVFFTDGRIHVRGKMTSRGKRKFADYILYHKSLGKHIRLAIIEAKDNSHTIRSGIQQALGYANTLDIPFVNPFPLFLELKVIFEKIERLMEKCSGMKTEISKSEVHPQMLIQAVPMKAFEG